MEILSYKPILDNENLTQRAHREICLKISDCFASLFLGDHKGMDT